MANLNPSQKADKAKGALAQLHRELNTGLAGDNNQQYTIREFLKEADEFILARLFDIVTGGSPEPLGATENIGSVAP